MRIARPFYEMQLLHRTSRLGVTATPHRFPALHSFWFRTPTRSAMAEIEGQAGKPAAELTRRVKFNYSHAELSHGLFKRRELTLFNGKRSPHYVAGCRRNLTPHGRGYLYSSEQRFRLREMDNDLVRPSRRLRLGAGRQREKGKLLRNQPLVLLPGSAHLRNDVASATRRFPQDDQVMDSAQAQCRPPDA